MKIHFLDTQLTKKKCCAIIFLLFKKEPFEEMFFPPKLLKKYITIYNITMDPDPNWAKLLETDPNSMYLGPQHW